MKINAGHNLNIFVDIKRNFLVKNCDFIPICSWSFLVIFECILVSFMLEPVDIGSSVDPVFCDDINKVISIIFCSVFGMVVLIPFG